MKNIEYHEGKTREEKLFNLQLHETCYDPIEGLGEVMITRVQTGWLYTIPGRVTRDNIDRTIFVPLTTYSSPAI